MNQASRVLILSFSRIASDPRVLRQIGTLSSRAALTVAGFGPTPDTRLDYVELPLWRGAAARAEQVATLALRMYERCYWSAPRVAMAERLLAGRRFDVVIANDIHAMPLAHKLARGAGVLLDAHEYAPTEFSDRLAWRVLFQPYVEYLCKAYIPVADAMTTVGHGIAQQYKDDFGVSPAVVYSAPRSAGLEPSHLVSGRIRLIHHGAAIPSRRLEDMIRMVPELDERFTLDLMLTPSQPRYLERLKAIAAEVPRVRVLPPVPTSEIVGFSNAYDIGLYILPPVNVNAQYALPNKFFEFIQARLAVAIGPSVEMKRLVAQYDCGIVGETFDPRDLAAKLNALDGPQLEGLKRNTGRAASELCWEHMESVFLDALEAAKESRRCAA